MLVGAAATRVAEWFRYFTTLSPTARHEIASRFPFIYVTRYILHVQSSMVPLPGWSFVHKTVVCIYITSLVLLITNNYIN